jgi:hypothetical protein
MNLSTTSSATASSCDRPCDRKSADPRQPREARDPSACDAFAQALRSQQRQRRFDDDEQEPAAESEGLPTMPTTLLSQAPALPHASRAGAIDLDPSGTRAAVEASLRETPCPQATALHGSEPPTSWEVSLHEPNSVALQMQAVRTERTGTAEPNAAWGLTIASPSVDAEILARHAPRLNERLRKHAIGPEHVRIERADDNAAGDDDH